MSIGNWRSLAEIVAPIVDQLDPAELGGPVFVIRLRGNGDDDVRKLRWILKILLRRYGLRCLSITQEAAR
jgi:hypothetical protein